MTPTIRPRPHRRPERPADGNATRRRRASHHSDAVVASYIREISTRQRLKPAVGPST